MSRLGSQPFPLIPSLTGSQSSAWLPAACHQGPRACCSSEVGTTGSRGTAVSTARALAPDRSPAPVEFSLHAHHP